MTKKRHVKLVRAFATRVHEWGMKESSSYKAPHGKQLYNCVRLAEQGRIPAIPDRGIFTRQDWWDSIALNTLEIWGMDNIKEAKLKERI